MTLGRDLPPDYLAWIDKVLRARVRRHCPGWLAAYEDDIHQDVFLRVIKIHERYEEEWRVSASYLGRAAVNGVRDAIRKVSGLKTDNPSVWEEADAPPEPTWIDPAAGPDELADWKQRGKHLLDCVRALHGSYRQAVMLRIQGYTIAEVAKEMGGNEKQAENAITRGRQRLRVCLESKGVEL
ncbi:MAG TPA: sigma-70 family RNA polymerase sigma factor [Thermoanaerobaculia bacterium]|nr:sigma-70 family RNA polymerase sigma factor [Thermoanaerobaculia bacterium]